MDKPRSYDADTLTVTWSAERCIHFKACVRGLEEVFDVEQKPWIQPAKAEADRVVEVALRCPTGALHVAYKDGGDPEVTPETNTVSVAPDGPLYLRGDLILKNAEGETILKDRRVALCRCGASGHKPFCDGSHTEAGFRDSGAFAPNDLGTTDEGAERLSVTASRNGPLVLSGKLTLRSVGDLTRYTGSKGALCRCGQSGHKPFCDGSHKAAGFESP